MINSEDLSNPFLLNELNLVQFLRAKLGKVILSISYLLHIYLSISVITKPIILLEEKNNKD